MAKAIEPERVLLIAGVMVSKGLDLDIVKDNFDQFGNIVDTVGPVDFSAITDYYDNEMGTGIKKYYLHTDRIIDPSELKTYKVISNGIEQKLSIDGKRRVNFDVGYIESSKLVLASAKNFYHRIYLGDGIYAEITMYYKEKEFHFLPWTYADYKKEDVMNLLKRSREYLRERMK